jgi:hypothetical protein
MEYDSRPFETGPVRSAQETDLPERQYDAPPRLSPIDHVDDRQEHIARAVALQQAVAYLSPRATANRDVLETAEYFLDFLRTGVVPPLKEGS